MSATYTVIKDATDPQAMAGLLAEIISPVLPSVQVKKVKLKNTRLEAPRLVWNTYEARLELPGGVEATSLFWTKAYFNRIECLEYAERIEGYLSASEQRNPLDPAGYARFYSD